ncbi:MAG: hypothetical protein C0518_12505 [Opitutus sp.]|nr:hypothetical protein [Opitutus sp.]
MFSRPLLVLACSFFLLGALTACGDKRDAAATPKTVNDYFEIKIGAQKVKMQLAVLESEVQRGLMFRKSMGRDEGMLFVFPRSQQMGFWMRNTTLPLDIGYIDREGVLREIYPLYPLDEKTVTSRGRDLQFALEMNQGWFKDRGVKPGDKLDLAALREALKARDFRPEALGLR